jgi:DNA-directed RNA polymerase subunit RPC12/RpoP
MSNLMPKPPLRLHTKRARKAVLAVLGVFAAMLLVLWWKMPTNRGNPLETYGTILFVSAALSSLVGLYAWWKLRRLIVIGRDFTETDAHIEQRIKRDEAGPVEYHFEFRNPKTGTRQKGVLQTRHDQGGPLYIDSTAHRVVVLVSNKHPNWFTAVRSDGYPFALDQNQLEALRHRMVERNLPLELGIGLKHRIAVQRALRVLLAAEASGVLPARPNSGIVDLPKLGDAAPSIGVQRLARAIALAYKFDPGTLLVTLKDELDASGRVEVENGNFFIELRRELLDKPRELEMVLAHEVAHVFLANHGIVDSDRFDLEVQTELASALWGFWRQMLADHEESREELSSAPHQTLVSEKLGRGGYITGEELAYALAKVYSPERLLKHELALPKLARDALRTGIRLANRERKLGVFGDAPLFNRLRYRLHRRLRNTVWRQFFSDAISFEQQKVIFACPRCSQRMRLPLEKSGTATCPNCKTRVPFAS